MSAALEPYYSNGLVALYLGDCIEVMRSLPDNSVHAIVTDPPYGLGFMGKEWDDLPPGLDFAVEALRVLKPGGHMVAFGGSRTWHRLAVAVEDAGFEIRDSIAWLYGSGFPKSHNLDGEWQGWGTALKPAFEPIVVGRKPFAATVASNVLEHGVGALHIDACRVGSELITSSGATGMDARRHTFDTRPTNYGGGDGIPTVHVGRFPPNVILENTQAAELDKQTGVLVSNGGRGRGEVQGTNRNNDNRVAYGNYNPTTSAVYGDSGGASRFFPTFHYEAKAPSSERPNVDGLQHATVKPLDLMRWLVRLVTPPNGIVLEPFAGSGTTLEAALIEGFNVIGIECEADYLPLIMQRISKPLQQSLFSEGIA